MNVVQRRLDRLGVICDCFVRLYLCHAPPATMAGWQELRWVLSWNTSIVSFSVDSNFITDATAVAAVSIYDAAVAAVAAFSISANVVAFVLAAVSAAAAAEASTK